MKGEFMRQIAIFTGLLFAGTSAFGADTQLLNLVMPDAQVMAGVNVTTAKISPFGQYILAHIGTGPSGDAGLQKFIAETGFDPRQDVTEILAASAGNPASPGGLILTKGTFDVAKIVAAVAANANQQTQTYAGATLIVSANAKTPHALAFLGSTIAVAGDVTSVKAALDRANGVNSISPALATRVQALSTTEDAWSVSLASLSGLIPGGIASSAGAGSANQTLQLVKDIQSSSGGVKFGSNVAIVGQAVATDPQNATALADVIRMIASLAAMGSAGNPQAASVAQLLQTLQVSTDGAAVNISLSVPETQVESLLQTAAAKKPSAAVRKL
jgi:hypothetical protein